MEFIFFAETDKRLYKEQIIEMMHISDKDFIPPLSARNSTLQKDLSNAVESADGIHKYYSEMEKQEILGVFDEGNFVGFVSFRQNFSNDVISKNTFPNIYLSTLILKPETRGKGITRKMYDYLFNQKFNNCNVFTRTWSTNVAHTKILDGFGFSELFRIDNDRGEGVDTVYFSLLRDLHD